MGRKRLIKEKDLLEAIKASEKAQRAIKDEEETTLDLVEGKALSKINDGDGAMIRFYLATKGKKRGYTYEERLEGDEDDDNEPLSIICDGEEVDPQPVEADE